MSTSSSTDEAISASLRSVSLNPKNEEDAQVQKEDEQIELDRKPLLELFQRGEKIHLQIQEGKIPPMDPKYLDLHEQAFDLFSRVHKAITEASIFSSNEELEDINTADLKYLYVSYYLGDLLTSWPGYEGRSERVKQAMTFLNRFLIQCDLLKMITKEDKNRWKNCGPPPMDGNLQALMAFRDMKMAKARRMKEVEDKVKAIVDRREKKRQRKKDLDEQEEENDEDEREYVLAIIQHFVQKAIDHVEFARREIQMLEVGAKLRAEEEKRRQMMGMFSQQQQGASSSSLPPQLAQLANLPPNHPLFQMIPSLQQRIQSQAPSQQPMPSQVAVASSKPKVMHIKDARDAATAPIPSELSSLLHRVTPSPAAQAKAASQAYSISASSAPRPTASLSSSIDQQVRSRTDRSHIFRDPNPATISIEQWAESQMEAGLLPRPSTKNKPRETELRRHNNEEEEERLRQQEEEEEDAREDQLTEEQEEAKLKETRAWDDWKDDHEKGMGNRMK